MAISWTDDQRHAIDSTGGTLLVSAAAGSGKTAVLVERLLSRVIRERIDIDRFLMITYTNAAASELRAKIISSLSDKIYETPEDKHLARQMRIVHRASISTIHAYCMQILRTHGHLSGIPSDFKIIDESEAKILCRKALEDLLEDEYAKDSAEFNALVDALYGDRDDKMMAESVLELHSKSRTHPNPEKWLSFCAEMYSDGTQWEEKILSYIRELCNYAKERFKFLTGRAKGDAAIDAAYSPALRSDIENMEKLESADGWDSLYDALLDMQFANLSPVRGCEAPELKDFIQTERNSLKKEILNIQKKFLNRRRESAVAELNALSPIASELCRLARELDVRYCELKRARSVLDYADLEHEALKLLVESYDEREDILVPTQLARELSRDFCEIMVDEYQDSNCIQDVIFRAISKDEENLVMVGDLKQSIYRFRLADPTIFLKKYYAFKEYSDAKQGDARVVRLSKNFRSREEVLSSCNSYFSLMMSERLGELEYTPEEYLNYGASYGESDMDCETELVMVDLKSEDDGEELTLSNREVEAKYIAARIAELKRQGRKYGDIVILLRALASRAKIYEKALREYGIPCISEKKEGLLGTVEVGILVSFLQVVDNPLWDISLVSTLRSPLFGFTADDLAYVRRSARGFFFDALKETAKAEGECARKCREFLEILNEFRTLAGEIGADELIWKLLDKTGARGMFGAMEGGSERVQHLQEFYNYAERFEQGGFKGLHAFLNHIAKITELGSDISASSNVDNTDAVRIMTIHKSKGLEFPIVFLADCNRKFNEMDLRGQVLTHPKYGIGLNFRDNDLRCENPSIARQCIELALREESKSEELRVLYVAMTRAKEKLIVVCTEKDAKSRMLKAQAMISGDRISPIVLLRATYADLWFILPLLTRADMFKFSLVPMQEIPQADSSASKHYAQASDEEQLSILKERFSFKYPFESATVAESKLTATGIAHSGTSTHKHFARPEFKKAQGLSATERGIALHLAMQLIKFENCNTYEGVKEELLRLKNGEFITAEQYDAISAEKIFAFFESELGQAVKNSKKIWREFKFSRLIEVSEHDSALLQGVVDLMFVHEGKISIVDFKTDRSITDDRIEQYARQVGVYAESVEKILGMPVLNCHIYFLQHGRDIIL